MGTLWLEWNNKSCLIRCPSPVNGGEPVLLTLMSNGRRGGIRTRDPLHPMQVRYQAALHAEEFYYNVQTTLTVLEIKAHLVIL